jgi:hypothetical protein
MAEVSAGPDDEALAPLHVIAAGRPEGIEALRAAVADGRLPGPSAHGADGTPLYPSDLLRPVDEAGGLDRLREDFEGRYVLAADAAGVVAGPDELDDVWWSYIEGRLGAELRHVTPENVVRRDRLRTSVAWLLDHPDPGSWRWRDRLRARVTALEALERPQVGSLSCQARGRHPEAFDASGPAPDGPPEG